jgi:hypothetical protein
VAGSFLDVDIEASLSVLLMSLMDSVDLAIARLPNLVRICRGIVTLDSLFHDGVCSRAFRAAVFSWDGW